MPLRAKIQNPAIAGSAANMSSGVPIPQEEPGDEPDDVLFNTLYGVRLIELNRPKKLNSLNGSMARKIIPRLKEWEKSQLANVIIIAGSGEKAFCAGGDVAALAVENQEGPEGQDRSKAYFGLEYQLDHLIATYPKPYIAYLDGITMGGGVGLSVHAPFRIATERTVFAMPETTIGFFPDVGGSFFLPRLDGRIGTYLALTSDRLHGVNAFYAGIATHYIHSSSLPNLTTRLAELQFKDYDSLATRLENINTTIEEFNTGLPHDQPMLLSGALRAAIDRCFRANTVEGIINDLRKESESARSKEIREWATKSLQTMSERSPTSLKVTLRQMRTGKTWSIKETFQREYHIAARFMEHPDFVSGVTARLLSKPPRQPEWKPTTLNEVSNSDIDEFFRVEGEKKFQLLGHEDYRDYPFWKFGLPREDEVMRVVQEGNGVGGERGREEVIGYFLQEREGKVGVREKVEEILDRRCQGVEEGKGLSAKRKGLSAEEEE
ncbi:MAG: hypothetical protein MMC33_006774 [Icmadophila ericetorum]|nr:hypothetical protein [Icmadophila ericetorum]